MVKFVAAEYKERLALSTSCETCEKVPLPKETANDSYVFISYSHKDYKKVYCDLADLYESGISFWYDGGLPAGKNWDDVVREKMTDARCSGVIFYLSENLFLSEALQTEIRIACGEDGDSSATDTKNHYFCVNLTSSLPSKILQSVFSLKSFQDTEDVMAAQSSWVSTLSNAFPDKATYLPFESSHHKDDLVQQIDVNFGIRSKYNPFDFSTAILRSGYGVLEFPNGTVYEGSYLNGLFEGQGKLRFPDGSSYEGEWKEGKSHGFGKITCLDGYSYEGEWANGKSSGQGKITYRSGGSYEGELQNGRRHGRGKKLYWSGAVYDGEWKEGLRHGYGKMINSDGSSYEGEWENDKPYGMGTRIYADGRTYVGNWVYGKRHGYGTEKHVNGCVYEGEWRYDKRYGHGKIFYTEGEDHEGTECDDKLTKREKGNKFFYFGGFYEGDVWCGKPHGYGKITYKSGGAYEGNWAFGKREGFGTAFYRDGRRYVGLWSEDLKHGCGTMIYPDGTEEKGNWENGNPIDDPKA